LCFLLLDTKISILKSLKASVDQHRIFFNIPTADHLKKVRAATMLKKTIEKKIEARIAQLS